MTSSGEDTVEGTLERIVFHNPDNQWTVARLEPSGGGPQVSVVGALVGVPPGTPLRLRGQWQDDPRFGRQFKVHSYQTCSPETVLGIERYLGSGLVPGIGPELAKRMVERFGLDTLSVIEKQSHRLTEVSGIGPTRARGIAQAWNAQKDIQDVMVFLRGHGISAAYAARIYKRYGSDAIAIVRANPYRLAVDIWGIGFKSADSIARSLGIAQDAPERMAAGALHVLGELVEDGHVHAPADVVHERAADMLQVDHGGITAAIEQLVADGLLIRETLAGRDCLSLEEVWRTEGQAAAALARLCTTEMKPWQIDVEAGLAWFEDKAGLELAEAQRKAVAAALTDKCTVITGGPGVGKTTIVKAISTLLLAKRRAVALAAPTGRAAKRLSEATGAIAVTLHRLLEFQPQTGSFARDGNNPLEVDTVIVDEVSMVDIALFRALIDAIPAGAQLVMVGDVDQLPSVGPGAVLDDVIASGAVTVVRLTEIFRQAAQSRIVTNAHRVNRGEEPELDVPAGDAPERSDFYFVDRDDPRTACHTLLDLVTERIPTSFGFDPVREVQVLTPMHRGELGTITLNQLLQARLNPPAAGRGEISRGERIYRVGDKVMQLRNDYDKEVFNGDVGIIRDLRPGVEDGERVFDIEMADGRMVEYAQTEVDQLGHAYAISVHKSQGSEYPAIVLPLVTQHYMMLRRNLLYTAITRGKKLVVLIGSRRAVRLAVRDESAQTRWTWLAERIRAALHD